MPINYDIEYPKLQREYALLLRRDEQNTQMIDQFRKDNDRAEYIRRQQVQFIRQLMDQIEELKPYEQMADTLTAAMQPWGWQHVTDGDDLVREIQSLMNHMDLLSNRIKLAQRLNQHNLPGFISDALGGEDLSDIPFVGKSTLLEYLDACDAEDAEEKENG